MLKADEGRTRFRRRKRVLTPEEKWVRQLGSVWPARRKRARQALAERGPAITDLLLTTCQQDKATLGLGFRRFFLYWGLGLITASLVEWLKTDPFPNLPRAGWIRLYVFLCACLATTIGAQIAMLASTFPIIALGTRRREMWGLLATMNDVRVCGPLAERLRIPTPKSQRVTKQNVEAALVRLLPQLTEDNIPDWNGRQRGCLRVVLKRAVKAPVITPETAPLVCAVLQATATLGDLRAQDYVRWLVKRTPQNEAETQVVQAAQQCEEALQQWLERSRNGEMLLRGSSRPAASPETLLRVAPVTAYEEPQQLVRASTKEEMLPPLSAEH